MRVLFFIFISLTTLFAENVVPLLENNITQEQIKEQEKKIELDRELTAHVAELKAVNESINQDSVWLKSYNTYLTSIGIGDNLKDLQKKIKELSRKKKKSDAVLEEISALKAKEKILADQVDLLKGDAKIPFAKLLTPESIDDIPTINTPFDIFTGISFVKVLDQKYDEYSKRRDNLKVISKLIAQKVKVLKAILALNKDDKEVEDDLKKSSLMYEKFKLALDTVESTSEVYIQRIKQIEEGINKSIKTQTYKLLNISIIVSVVFLLFFTIKLIVKKYIIDNERFYMANKIINFSNFTLIFLIVVFNYIENVSYFVTVLGFASAGIAIAMKDWFMSMLGWLVIVIGGSIHVGDRIRVDMDGKKYVGDVMDISLLRMTLLEDITLTTIRENRRAGRIIFIPNNYVFTTMIANYSHHSLKTVWDGIDVTITFDSNHKKAMHITKEITRKFSKGYTDITRKQLNKLRTHYSLKNTNVEPRVFSFIEENGMKISSWYLTNAYATLTLRSTISADIIDAFNAEDDITIAYPTQRLHVRSEKSRKLPDEDENANQKSLF